MFEASQQTAEARFVQGPNAPQKNMQAQHDPASLDGERSRLGCTARRLAERNDKVHRQECSARAPNTAGGAPALPIPRAKRKEASHEPTMMIN